MNSGSVSRLRPSALAIRMVVYASAFVAFILVLVPLAFHHGADALGWHERGSVLFTCLGPLRPHMGASIFGAGLIAYFLSSLWLVLFGKGPFVEFDPPREFVATGPYRWMRNPVAASLIISGLGEAIYFGSVGMLLFVLMGLPLAHLQVTRIEEPRLRQRFGSSYEDYCRHVNRWLPRRPTPD